MPRTKKSSSIDEKALKKGELRKLNALRKSLGDDIANAAFAEWYSTRSTQLAEITDRNAELIADELYKLVEKQGIQIPRGGYYVKRGRGRVIVTSAAED